MMRAACFIRAVSWLVIFSLLADPVLAGKGRWEIGEERIQHSLFDEQALSASLEYAKQILEPTPQGYSLRISPQSLANSPVTPDHADGDLDWVGLVPFARDPEAGTRLILEDLSSADRLRHQAAAARAGNLDLDSDLLALELRARLNQPVLGDQVLNLMVALAAGPTEDRVHDSPCLSHLAAAIALGDLTAERFAAAIEPAGAIEPRLSQPLERQRLEAQVSHLTRGLSSLLTHTAPAAREASSRMSFRQRLAAGAQLPQALERDQLFEEFITMPDPTRVHETARIIALRDDGAWADFLARLQRRIYLEPGLTNRDRHRAAERLATLFQASFTAFSEDPVRVMNEWLVLYESKYGMDQVIVEMIAIEDLKGNIEPARVLRAALANPLYRGTALGILIEVFWRNHTATQVWRELASAVAQGELAEEGTPAKQRDHRSMELVQEKAVEALGTSGQGIPRMLAAVKVDRDQLAALVPQRRTPAIRIPFFTSTPAARVDRSMRLLRQEMGVKLRTDERKDEVLWARVQEEALRVLRPEGHERHPAQVLADYVNIIEPTPFLDALRTAGRGQREILLQVLSDLVVIHQAAMRMGSKEKKYFLEWLSDILGLRGISLDHFMDWSKIIQLSQTHLGQTGIEIYMHMWELPWSPTISLPPPHKRAYAIRTLKRLVTKRSPGGLLGILLEGGGKAPYETARLEAMTAFQKLKLERKELILVWVNVLKSGKLKAPKSAILELEKLNLSHDEGLNIWLVALQSENALARILAAHELGELGDKQATVPLIRVLRNDSHDESQSPESHGYHHFTVRRAAARALGKIKDMRAVTPLIEQLDVRDPINPSLPTVAAEALGQIGDPSALPALEQALKDEDSDVRQAAAKAIKTIEERQKGHEGQGQWCWTRLIWQIPFIQKLFRDEHAFTAFFEEVFVPVIVPGILGAVGMALSWLNVESFGDLTFLWLLVYRLPFLAVHYVGVPPDERPQGLRGLIDVLIPALAPLSFYGGAHALFPATWIAIAVGLIASYLFHRGHNKLRPAQPARAAEEDLQRQLFLAAG